MRGASQSASIHNLKHSKDFNCHYTFGTGTLFSMGRYIYRAWVTNLPLTPAGIWHFYDGRAGMEPRICELREDFALCKIPTASFSGSHGRIDPVTRRPQN